MSNANFNDYVCLPYLNIENTFLISNYKNAGGYSIFEELLKDKNVVDVREEILSSGLYTKGPFSKPISEKWDKFERKGEQEHLQKKVLIANGQESLSGSFKDRYLMENFPHQVIESILITSFLWGIDMAFLVIRPEYSFAHERMMKAYDEAMKNGYLGENIFDSGYYLNLTISLGNSGVSSGEETAIVNGLEGKRSFPSVRDLSLNGYLNRTTLVHNIETLLNISWISKMGAAAFRKLGTINNPGTKLISVSGDINYPGVFEVPLGTTFVDILEDFCGGSSDPEGVQAIFPAGVYGHELSELDIPLTRLSYESLSEKGIELGSGNLLFVGKGRDLEKVKEISLKILAESSCGYCTVCRDGLPRFAVNYKSLSEIELSNTLEGLALSGACSYSQYPKRLLKV